MALDVDAARRAIARRRARRSASDIDATAMAIVRIANNNMIGALRSVLIERGLDPRDFTLWRSAAPGRCTPAS